MKRTQRSASAIAIILLAMVLTSLPLNTVLAEPPQGFAPLFNGTDLSGWKGLVGNPNTRAAMSTDELSAAPTEADESMRAHWKVVEGAIQRDGKGDSLCTDKDYGDFELYVLDSEDAKYATLDPRQYHGSVYGLAAARRGYLRPIDEWNFQQVTVRGSNVKVERNGFTILDADLATIKESKDGSVPAGTNRTRDHFGFAGHNDPMAFRNVSVRELPGEPAQPPTRDTAVSPIDGPIKLFNGRNLEGFYTWIRDSQYSDPKKVFTVQDGMIHISGDGYGGLITNRSYRDYHLIVEFKWGAKTWGDRVDRARDSGLLVHGWGPDGGYANTWMASIEAQIIEGGVGDILVLSGVDPITGQSLPTSLTAEITKDRDGEKVWKQGGERITVSSGRINWFGRDVDWADKINFRGKDDVESPFGEWTRLEVIADGGHLLYKVNGIVVNEAFEAKPDFGKLLLQTEQAEMFVRRFELYPLEQAPTDELTQ